MLNTREPLLAAPPVTGFALRLVDEHTLEADISKEQNLNELFASALGAGHRDLSMRNKVNRLEEMFMRLVETGAGAAAAGTGGSAGAAVAHG